MTEKLLPVLLPCPFCGEKGELQVHPDPRKYTGNLFSIECGECFARTFEFSNNEEITIKRWNTRQERKVLSVEEIEKVMRRIWEKLYPNSNEWNPTGEHGFIPRETSQAIFDAMENKWNFSNV